MNSCDGTYELKGQVTTMALFPTSGGFVPGNLSDWLDGQDVDRQNRYRSYLDFYEGMQWDRRPRAGETRLTANYARALVRKVGSYVFAEPVIHQIPDDAGGTPEQRRRAADWLDLISSEQDLHTLDFQTLLDAAVLGDGCFKVTWDSAQGRPIVSSVDPSGLWAWSQPGNVRRVRRVVQRYTLQPEEAEDLFELALPGQGKIQAVEDWTDDRLRIELNSQVIQDDVNPYGRIPYVLFPNLGKPHELWGESDLVDLMDICREINRRMTVISRILQVSGNPIVVLENVSGSDGIRADEGAIWELPEDSRAYLLDMLQGGGVQLHLDYVQLLFRTLFDLSETPRTSFGDSGRALSGTALEVEIQPLVQKVQRKRRIWDSVYRRRNALVLDQLERFGGEDLGGVRRSEPVWGPILPRDREAQVRAETTLVSHGVRSRRSAMLAFGTDDPEQEWAKVIEEGAASSPFEGVARHDDTH
jgi:hypothetical protein